jgi:hypothetical protein
MQCKSGFVLFLFFSFPIANLEFYFLSSIKSVANLSNR